MSLSVLSAISAQDRLFSRQKALIAAGNAIWKSVSWAEGEFLRRSVWLGVSLFGVQWVRGQLGGR